MRMHLGLWLLVALALPVLAADPPTAELTLELRLPGDTATLSPSAQIRLRRASGTAPDRVLPLPNLHPQRVEVEPDTTWEVVLEAPGLWAPREVVTVGAASTSSRLALRVWPAVPLKGVARLAEAGGELPERLACRVEIGGGSHRGTVECPVTSGGRFECQLPAEEVDLRLSATGYVPHYRWGLRLDGEEAVALGTLTLEPGASISGSLEAPGIDPSTVALSLVPAVADGGGSPAAVYKLAGTRVTGAANARGFFQLTGVAAGVYLLEAKHPQFATARLEPFTVPPRAEVVLSEPIRLRPPLDLTLTVDPPVDGSGQPWRVVIHRAFDTAAYRREKAVYDGPTMRGEPLVIPDQAPGRFSVSIFRNDRTTLHSETFSVTSEADADWAVTLDLLEIEGEVFLGAEPLEAALYFGGPKGASRLRFDSDEEGRFTGIVPGPGSWDVLVEAAVPPVRHLTRVEVEDAGSSRRQLRIEIPDTMLFGRVVDEAEKAAGPAVILVDSAAGSFDFPTDEQGEFEIRGIEEGSLALFARAGSARGEETSEPVSTLLTEDRPSGPVVLRLRRLVPLRGQVFSLDGPVAGAAVLLLPPPGTFGFGQNARTDVDGSFSMEVPASVERFHVLVSPPGHALKTFEIDTGYGDMVALRVPRESGVVEITMPMEQTAFRQQGLHLRVQQNGVILPMGVLYPWAISHGGQVGDQPQLTLPALAPGHYRVCTSSGAASEHCAAGYLDGHGSLRLDLRGAAEALDAGLELPAG